MTALMLEAEKLCPQSSSVMSFTFRVEAPSDRHEFVHKSVHYPRE